MTAPSTSAPATTPTTALTHLAIQEAQDGKAADWFEPVSDQDYGAST